MCSNVAVYFWCSTTELQVRAADEAEGDTPQSSTSATANGTAGAAAVVVERNACSSFSRPKVRQETCCSIRVKLMNRKHTAASVKTLCRLRLHAVVSGSSSFTLSVKWACLLPCIVWRTFCQC
jgi:hypothetical protein